MSDINISDYVSEEEKKEVCLAAFKSIASEKARHDLERIMNNSAYQFVYDAVDSVIDGDVEKIIRDKVVSIISEMTTFNLFNKPDAWSKETNHGYEILHKAVIDNTDLIRNKVLEAVIKATDTDKICEEISDRFPDLIMEVIRKGATND